jgi:hypothetical protein
MADEEPEHGHLPIDAVKNVWVYGFGNGIFNFKSRVRSVASSPQNKRARHRVTTSIHLTNMPKGGFRGMLGARNRKRHV